MAQKKIVYSEQSLKDLDRIVKHVANNLSEDLAILTYREIRAAINSLIKFPKLGNPSLKHLLQRQLVVKKNTIYYSEQDDDIVITNIRPRKTSE